MSKQQLSESFRHNVHICPFTLWNTLTFRAEPCVACHFAHVYQLATGTWVFPVLLPAMFTGPDTFLVGDYTYDDHSTKEAANG